MYKDKGIIAAETFWNEAYKEEKTEVLYDGDYFVLKLWSSWCAYLSLMALCY